MILRDEMFDIRSFEPWGDTAISTFERIKAENKMDELDDFLMEYSSEGLSPTEINDLLRFEYKYVLEALGIEEDKDNEEW